MSPMAPPIIQANVVARLRISAREVLSLCLSLDRPELSSAGFVEALVKWRVRSSGPEEQGVDVDERMNASACDGFDGGSREHCSFGGPVAQL